jgi:cation-transporting P-type ATPase E
MADAAASTPLAPAALTPQAGLSSAQVAERRSRGLTNAGGERTSRSVAEILRANILTRFNLILGVLLAVILAVGQPQDALFGIVLVTNALIGIGQELPSAAQGLASAPPGLPWPLEDLAGASLASITTW